MNLDVCVGALGILCSILFILFHQSGFNRFLVCTIKSIPIVALLYFASKYNCTMYFQLGLLSSAIADFILKLGNEGLYFIIGGTFFVLTHVFYVMNYLTLAHVCFFLK